MKVAAQWRRSSILDARVAAATRRRRSLSGLQIFLVLPHHVGGGDSNFLRTWDAGVLPQAVTSLQLPIRPRRHGYRLPTGTCEVCFQTPLHDRTRLPFRDASSRFRGEHRGFPMTGSSRRTRSGVQGHLNGATVQRQLREALATRGISTGADDAGADTE